jgi:hypothetical protein
MYGSEQPHTFFDPRNPEAAAARKRCADQALIDMVEWITSEENVFFMFIHLSLKK